MLVASPILPEPVATPLAEKRRRPSIRAPQARTGASNAGGLVVWMIVGLGVLACVPGARGSDLFGASGPFWLVGAPALNLLWLCRRRLVAAAVTGWKHTHARRRAHGAVRISTAPRLRRRRVSVDRWASVMR